MTELVCEAVGAAAPVKTCSRCGFVGAREAFAQKGRWCRSCESACKQAWAAANRDRVKANHCAWRGRNKAKLADLQRKFYAENRETVRRMKREYMKRRRTEDPGFKIMCALRTRVRTTVVKEAGAKKAARTAELVGCSIESLRAHLEAQFTAGMSWANYGGESGWQIDHYIACAQFDLADPAQQKICMNWRNLRPLSKQDNFDKDDILPHDWRPRLDAICSALGLPAPTLRDGCNPSALTSY